jgi:Ni,Fe-hydrogenase III component G
MTRDEVVNRIRSAFGDRLIDLQQPSGKRLYLEVEPHAIPDTARFLSGELEARLQTASAVDAPRKIEILYHWALDSIGMVVTVRTRIDRDQPEIESITPICPAAHWIEREMWELMGISFKDHPDLRHLLLLDDWPEGKYPLRRDYRKE